MKNTTLCYIEKEEKYLMIQRTRKKKDGSDGKYLGVGGHFEDKESPFDCVIREAREETGLTLLKPEYRGIITFVSDEYQTELMHLFTCSEYEGELMHLFTCSEYEGELTECTEGKLVWVEKSELKNLPLWEGDFVFLELLNTRKDFFSLKLEYKKDKLVSSTLYN